MPHGGECQWGAEIGALWTCFALSLCNNFRVCSIQENAHNSLVLAQVLDRRDCLSSDGSLLPERVEAKLRAALTSLGMLRETAVPAHAEHARTQIDPTFHLVVKPSNADGGSGLHAWLAGNHLVMLTLLSLETNRTIAETKRMAL